MLFGSCLRGNDNADAVSPQSRHQDWGQLCSQNTFVICLLFVTNSLHSQLIEQEGEFGSQFCAFSPWFVGSLL